LSVEVGNYDQCAIVRERLRSRSTNAAGGPGDQRYLIPQIDFHWPEPNVRPECVSTCFALN
jgi:hypothetical protein